MGIQFLITKAIAGRAVAERSEQRRLERKYSKTAEDLKSVTEVWHEHPVLESSASSTRSTSSYLDPLPPRLPQEGTILRGRPPLERSQSERCTFDYESLLARPRSVAPASTAQGQREAALKTVYSFNNVWESQKGNFRGIGRHTMSVDATPEDQMSHLHRTMSDLTPRMVQHLGDFDVSGIEPCVWDDYRKLRTESTASSASSQSIANLMSHRECPDPKRRVTVTRGFAHTLISPSSSSAGDDESSHHRKDSTVSMTSVSSDGQPRHPRRKSRQRSMPVSDSGATSPLTTITENPDAVDKPQEKKGRPCKFDEAGNNDSALASSGSSDGGPWMIERNMAEQKSQLTEQIERKVKENREEQQLARPRTRSGDPTKPHQIGKPIVERSRTVKHVVRPVVRRAHSPKRAKGKSAAIKAPKLPTAPEQDTKKAVADAKAVCTAATLSQSPDKPMISTSAEEACENATDLSLYMEKTRSKRSSRDRHTKSRENGDDASISSSSTAKALIPLAKKMVEALPVHGRQRSATAFRVPPTMCQPANKAEGARPEASQAIAH